MFYLIYKITNNVNGKIYIGAHKTNDKNDGYMGSGKIIKKAINKYGFDKFTKDIIYEASSSEEMYLKEKELVELGKHSYNLKKGGQGGWDFNNSNPDLHTHQLPHLKMMAKNLQEKRKNDKHFDEQYKQSISKGLKEKYKTDIEYREKTISRLKTIWPGRNHKNETRLKMSKSHQGKHDGEKNTQYGTMWITNGIENKKIKKEENIPEGWNKGRKIKFSLV
jgi:hypothetical protein